MINLVMGIIFVELSHTHKANIKVPQKKKKKHMMR